MKHRINTGGVCVNCGLDVDQKLTTTCFGKPLHKHSITEILAGRLDYNRGWIDTSHKTESESALGQAIERLQKLFPDANIEVRELSDEIDLTGVHELMDFLYNKGPCTLVHLMELDVEPEQIINLLRIGRKKGFIAASIKDDVLVEYALTHEARIFHKTICGQDAPEPEEVLLDRTDLHVLLQVANTNPNRVIIYANAAKGIAANKLTELGLITDADTNLRCTLAGEAHIRALLAVPVLDR